MIKVLQVIWIYDRNIDPEKWKMFVCVEPDCLFFFRINSRDHYKPAIRIERDPHHRFLKYDSFIECNNLQEITEPQLEQSIKERGIVGRVHSSFARPIYEAVKGSKQIPVDDQRLLGRALVGEKHL